MGRVFGVRTGCQSFAPQRCLLRPDHGVPGGVYYVDTPLENDPSKSSYRPGPRTMPWQLLALRVRERDFRGRFRRRAPFHVTYIVQRESYSP